jgi:hypothetical protein
VEHGSLRIHHQLGRRRRRKRRSSEKLGGAKNSGVRFLCKTSCVFLRIYISTYQPIFSKRGAGRGGAGDGDGNGGGKGKREKCEYYLPRSTYDI